MLLFSTYVCKKENKLKILKENYQIIKIQEKVQIKGLILIFCQGIFLQTCRLCPGSGFVTLHTDPDPIFIIQIRIRITEVNTHTIKHCQNIFITKQALYSE